jgi:putative DNA primase/helicase
MPRPRCRFRRRTRRSGCGGRTELQGYLQRPAGYYLGGDLSEETMLFFYDTGRNSKTTFLNTLAAIMGDYAMFAPMDSFVGPDLMLCCER